MRFRTVTMEGFGPFKDRQVVDFTQFDADGVFLIGGETGAGKSTILDAIAYALYGATPRWEDVNATSRVRSDYCGPTDPTTVVLEFETNGREYRITRSPEYQRPRKNREGTTTQSAQAVLDALVGGGWSGMAVGPRDVGESVLELLKLNKDEFLQVILLAQGRFQRFLHADSKERLELLGKLFSTKRFGDYQQRIAARRGGLKQRVDEHLIAVQTLLKAVPAPADHAQPTVGEEIAWIDLIVEAARARRDESKGAATAAEGREKTASEALDVTRRQARAAGARQKLEALESQQAEIDIATQTVAVAERAERVRPLLDAVEVAAEAVADGVAGVETARLGYAVGVADTDLPSEVSRLDTELGTLQDALDEERHAGDLELQVVAAADEAERTAQQLALIDEGIHAVETERETLRGPAASAGPLTEKTVDLQSRLEAASAAVAVEVELHTAREAQLGAELKLDAARLRHTEVLTRFLHGQAASLAERLIPGSPCAVCGSVDHPAPATWDDEPVTEADLQRAQAEVESIEPTIDRARTAVATLQTEAARLTGIAGESAVAQLEADLAAVGTAATAALQAGQRLESIAEELDGEAGLRPRRTDLIDVTAEVARRRTQLTTEHGALLAKLTKLRGSHASVAERSTHLVIERDAATALGDALRAHASAASALQGAQTQLNTKAATEQFEDTAAARTALLDPVRRDQLDARIAQHSSDVQQATGVLNEPDLQDLPVDILDLAEAERAHTESQAATRASTASRATAEAALASLVEQRRSLSSHVDEVGALRSEFDVLNVLAETVNGRTPNTKNMSLESYYVAAELEDVLAAANGRLSSMTGGRYQLMHTERGILRANAAAGLELEVMDEFTGKPRNPHSLSGGETFLTSLALALGLAEVVTSRAGGVELDTLFIDEGFGSLSPDVLGIAMETLDSLKQGGRTIGVISHVDSMKEAIGAQVQVVRLPGGVSQVEQG